MKNRIREIRKRMGITMTQLAIEAGINASSLSMIERGQACNKATAEKVCDVLGEPVETVFKGAEFKR